LFNSADLAEHTIWHPHNGRHLSKSLSGNELQSMQKFVTRQQRQRIRMKTVGITIPPGTKGGERRFQSPSNVMSQRKRHHERHTAPNLPLHRVTPFAIVSGRSVAVPQEALTIQKPRGLDHPPSRCPVQMFQAKGVPQPLMLDQRVSHEV
jgi:hypothetical protein